MAVMPVGRQTDQEVERCGYNACVKTDRGATSVQGRRPGASS